ncbi:hypothetical protein ABK040_012937 [Willaertia magna]
MDQVVETAILEIGLEGYQGCTLENLINLFSEYHSDITLDEFMIKQLWVYLLRNPKLQFYQLLPNDTESNNNTQEITSPSKTKKSNKKPPQKNDFQFTTEGYTPYAEQKNNFDINLPIKRVGPIQDPITFLSHDSITNENIDIVNNYHKFLTNICIVANFDYRKYILGLGFRNDVFISEIQYCMLEEITRSRYKGRFQNDLTKFLFIDSRSTLYHLKRLYGLNLAYKESAYDPRSKTSSNLIHHCRFTDKLKQRQFLKRTDKELEAEEIYEQYLKVKENIIELVVDLLKTAKNNVLIDYELRKKLLHFVKDELQQKHKWERLKMTLQTSGKVEYFKAVVDNRLTYCVRLKNVNNEMENNFINNLISANDFITEAEQERFLGSGFDFERPQIYQMYEYIDRVGGGSGLHHTDIYQHFGMSSKISGNICSDLRKQFGVTSTAEKVDKQTTYRFFVPFSKVAQDENVEDGQLTPVDTGAVDQGDLTGDQPQVLLSPTRLLTPKKKKRKTSSKENEEESAPSTPQRNTPLPEHLTPSGHLIMRYKKGSENPRKFVITREFSERCQIVLGLIKEKKCVTRTQLREYFKKNGEPFDSKTMTRLIKYLEKTGEAKRLHIQIPSVIGTALPKEHIVVIDSSLNPSSPIVQEFIQSLRGSSVVVKAKEKVDKNTLEKFENIDHLQEKPSKKERTQYQYFYFSIRNGYINSKMLRVKRFHKFLFEKIFDGTINPDKLSLYDVYNNMTVMLFCELIGCITDIIVTDSNREELNNTTITLATGKIKEQIDASVVGSRKSIVLVRVETFLDILHKLGLVLLYPDYKETYFFKVLPTVKFPFPQQYPSIDYREFSFNSFNEIDEYWEELELCSLSIASVRDTEEKSKKSDNNEDISEIDKVNNKILDEIPDLGKKINWSETRHYSIRQLRVFESIYKENQEPNAALCHEIAKELRLACEQVIMYFYRYRCDILSNSLDNTLVSTKPKKKKPTKQNNAEKTTSSDDLSGEIETVTNEEEQPNNNRKGRLGSVVFLDSEVNVKQKEAAARHARAYRKRKKEERKKKELETSQPTRAPKWTNEQDLILLECLAEQRELDPNTGSLAIKPIKWLQIAEKIGDGMTPNRCKTRSDALMKLPWCKRALELTIGHRELMKSNPNAETISLRSVLQSCKDQITIGTVSEEHASHPLLNIELPKDISQLDKLFKVIRFEPTPLIKGRQKSLTPEKELRYSTLENLFRVILLTPDEEYNVNLANQLVRRFLPSEIETCFLNLRNKGLVSKSKRQGIRMKGYHLNVNFTSKTSINNYPRDLFDDTTKYKKRVLMLDYESSDESEDDESDSETEDYTKPIYSRNGIYFNPQTNGGMVAATLSLVMLNEIKLVPRVPPLTEEERNKEGVTSSSKDTDEDIGNGVSNHLLRVGAIRPGEDDQIVAEGTNIKSALGPLSMPEWQINIQNAKEPNVFSNLGLETEKEKYVNRVISEYGVRLSNVEFSIEMPSPTKDNKEEGETEITNKRKEREEVIEFEPPNKKQETMTESEMEAFIQTHGAHHSLPTLTQSHESILEKLSCPKELYTFATYLLMEEDLDEEYFEYWMKQTIIIYQNIVDSKGNGCSLLELQQLYQSLHSLSDIHEDMMDLSLNEILNQLTNFECIRSIDSEIETRYLSYEQSRIHTIPCKDSTEKPVSAFLELTGEVNENLLHNFKKCIISRIMRLPGITERKLIESIGVISARDIKKVINLLESEQIIHSSYHASSAFESLHTTNTLFLTDEELLEHQQTFYESHTQPERALFVTPNYIFIEEIQN